MAKAKIEEHGAAIADASESLRLIVVVLLSAMGIA